MELFKAVVRNRHIRIMMLLIILFTSMTVPFYSLTGHFKAIEDIASKYIPRGDTLLILDMDNMPIQQPGSEYAIVYVSPSSLDYNGYGISIHVYSFNDFEAASEILGIRLPNLEAGECLISRYIADDLGIQQGDIVTFTIGGESYSFHVKGFTRIFPAILPHEVELDKLGYILRSSGDMSGGIDGYALGSYTPLIKSLENEVGRLLTIWAIPIYLLTLVSLALVSSRFLYSMRSDLSILRTLGLSRIRLLLALASSLTPIILASSLAGVSLGLVLSQVAAKILYIAVGGITVVPSLDPITYLGIYILSALAGFIGIFSTLVGSGRLYEECA